MHVALYILVTFGIVALTTLCLFDLIKIGTTESLIFFFFSYIYLLASVWESALWHPSLEPHSPTLPYFMETLWGLFFGVIGVAFFTLYIMQIRHSENRKRRVIAMGLMLLGIALLFGVLEDYGCNVIWDQTSYFSPFYYTAIAGIILLGVAIYLLKSEVKVK